MAPPKYSGELPERYAVWSAHKGRCCYCRNLYTFENSMIDHVIPQRFNQSQYINRLNELINEIREVFELPNEFAIDTFYNVVLSCPYCNYKKGGHELPVKEIVFFLGEARNNYEKAKYEYQKLTRDKNLNEITTIIVNALIKKNITIDDIDDIKLSAVNKYTHHAIVEMDVWEENAVLTLGIAGEVKNIYGFEETFKFYKEKHQISTIQRDKNITLHLMSTMNREMYNKQYLYTGLLEKINGSLLLLPGKPSEIQLLLPPAI